MLQPLHRNARASREVASPMLHADANFRDDHNKTIWMQVFGELQRPNCPAVSPGNLPVQSSREASYSKFFNLAETFDTSLEEGAKKRGVVQTLERHYEWMSSREPWL